MDAFQVTDLLPEAKDAPWREDPDALSFLQELTGCSLMEIATESSRLQRQQESIQTATQQLAIHTRVHDDAEDEGDEAPSPSVVQSGKDVKANKPHTKHTHTALVAVAEVTEDVLDQFSTLSSHISNLHTSLPNLVGECNTFQQKGSKAHARVRQNTRLITHHSQVAELLELPQLMEACVKGRYYDEAIRLRQHVYDLFRKHGSTPIIKTIYQEVEQHTRVLYTSLANSLRQQLKLDEAMRTVGHMHTLNMLGYVHKPTPSKAGEGVFPVQDSFTHSSSTVEQNAMRMLFLQACEARMTQELSIPTTDAYAYLKRVVAINREQIFVATTQYRAIFATSLSPAQHETGDPLNDWVLRRIEIFLNTLRVHLPRLNDRFKDMLVLCMQFALSRGGSGMDFRPLLIPIFEDAILQVVRRRATAAMNDFIEALPQRALISHALISAGQDNDRFDSRHEETSVSKHSGKETRRLVQVPLSLMSSPLLALFANGLLGVLKDLADCAPLNIASDAVNHLGDILIQTANALKQFESSREETWSNKDKTAFKGLCSLFISTLVPCLVRCIEAIYPASSFRHTKQSAWPYNHLDVAKIAEPLESICQSACQPILLAAGLRPHAEPLSSSPRSPSGQGSPGAINSDMDQPSPVTAAGDTNAREDKSASHNDLSDNEKATKDVIVDETASNHQAEISAFEIDDDDDDDDEDHSAPIENDRKEPAESSRTSNEGEQMSADEAAISVQPDAAPSDSTLVAAAGTIREEKEEHLADTPTAAKADSLASSTSSIQAHTVTYEQAVGTDSEQAVGTDSELSASEMAVADSNSSTHPVVEEVESDLASADTASSSSRRTVRDIQIEEHSSEQQLLAEVHREESRVTVTHVAISSRSHTRTVREEVKTSSDVHESESSIAAIPDAVGGSSTVHQREEASEVQTPSAQDKPAAQESQANERRSKRPEGVQVLDQVRKVLADDPELFAWLKHKLEEHDSTNSGKVKRSHFRGVLKMVDRDKLKLTPLQINALGSVLDPDRTTIIDYTPLMQPP